MYDQIIKKLTSIEEEHNVTILYAVESGSRGWGFASKDSDYDVRFIYAHPLDWYVSVNEKKDFIECPISDLLDINGWDVRKTLQLYKKSNPPLLEWLSSPIVYRDNHVMAEALCALMPLYFNPVAGMYHYLHSARNKFDEIKDARQIKIKKYFYILRPLFACMWIEKYGTMPPMAFSLLLAAQTIDVVLHNRIVALIDKKKNVMEVDWESRDNLLIDYFKDTIVYYENYLAHVVPHSTKGDYALLNDLLLKTLKDVTEKRIA